MGGTMRLLVPSLLMGATGLVLTVVGFRSGDAQSVLAMGRWLGPVVLGAGLLLAGVGLLLRGRE